MTAEGTVEHILDVIAAPPGVWVVLMIKQAEETTYRREPVLAWAQVEDDEGVGVVGLVEGDAPGFLETIRAHCRPRSIEFGWFVVEGAMPLCHCGRLEPHEPRSTNDVRWCEDCAGIIDSA